MNKIIFSIIMVAIILLIIIILSKKYKLNKNQQIIFWILVLFWTSVTIIREYRKIYIAGSIATGGLGLGIIVASSITSAYGLVSVFIRMPVFFLTDILKKRKIFIQIALGLIIITGIFVVIKPSITTLYLSSIAMGVCASMLAIFNLIFSETFKESEAYVSASILSVAPLLSEFIAAPIQYLGTYKDVKNYSLLWIVSIAIAIITLMLSFKIEDSSNKETFSLSKVKFVISNKKFLFACFVGVMISFVKFSTSVNNMVYYNKTYLDMPPLLLAYLGPLFSGPQLIASVLIGTYFNKKFGIEKTLIFALSFLVAFNLTMLFTKNYIVAFIAYSLNGFGYGATYISLLSMAMAFFKKEYRNISMGIYQGFFAFGIFFGDRIYVLVSGVLNDKPRMIFLILLTILIFSMLISIFSLLFRKKMLK
ncbi:MFS transporter [Oceanivirga miroungae]|uniref:Major facilitator superfamily (MFS) profile domain-containing protein n=1 Tax=Oceanivirga miroungae TaxID=1130046 RepID=A0A6I8MAA4_9FUSO|nr:MFS transporter [Oceanivirga miroungae]VWL85092.1 hypothetical protein OMES3154_00374 [Oceanivirga miroungae]